MFKPFETTLNIVFTINLPLYPKDPEDLHYLWEEVLMLRNQVVSQHRSHRALPTAAGVAVPAVPSAVPAGPQAPQAPQEPEPPAAYNWIGKLHELCGKKLKRNLEKQELGWLGWLGWELENFWVRSMSFLVENWMEM